MAKPGRKKRTVLFVIELLVLMVLLGGLFVYGQISTKLGKMQSKELDMDKVEMNDLVSSAKMTGYTNIALFGVDSRDESNNYEDSTNSDTIIVVSIKNDTKEVRLCSLYRDTLLVIGQDSSGEDNYQKCNAAYATGGVEAAVSMLNTNLDLGISDYMTVNFNALATVIDLLGGLDIEMSGAEVEHMNNYCKETSKVTGKSYTPIPRPDDDNFVDTYHLNGVQATSYARIRYIGLDFQRTERQRLVIQKIVDKAKKSNLATLSKIMDEVFPLVQTSLSKEEIFSMGAGMLSYKIGKTTGFPFQLYSMDHVTKGDILVPTTLEYNVIKLHDFLFDDKNFIPSDTVKERSKVIEAITGYGFDPEKGEITISEAVSRNTKAPGSSTGTSEYAGSTDESWTDSSSVNTTYASSYSGSDSDSSADSSYTGGGYTGGMDSSAGDSDNDSGYTGGTDSSAGDSDNDSGYTGETDSSAGETDSSAGGADSDAGGDSSYEGDSDAGGDVDSSAGDAE